MYFCFLSTFFVTGARVFSIASAVWYSLYCKKVHRVQYQLARATVFNTRILVYHTFCTAQHLCTSDEQQGIYTYGI
ncbi:hypothetical protein BX070DRAFT_222144 [Coemansia spiralis]|nr:hypothetical protein BX070DRAFT_222144 [Coemansia spiralis]